ncbi:DUF1318 domain-containing protein [Puniceicoccus vermicola]|uniref:DUF1318 domain-containing protein n=1 Tax=Puniceicoccus vermicola TaxID=388746 RepID=A0A7X1B2D7_9BACT|nr:DUF1318 domain-containing protein [Puniceicoccus vermicola]MBC2604376.1 DUF1318 domain-containing protein [Puniceicoccus vermicola]
MIKHRPLLLILLIPAILSGSAALADNETTDLDDTVMQGSGAPDLSTLKNQLMEREDQINELMDQGLVGITNEGLYSIRGDISPMQSKHVQEQNDDLKAYYDIVAKEKGEDVEKVQKSSAAQMIKDAGPQVWVQDEEGDWFQK